MAKVTVTRALITIVSFYGVYRVIKSTQRRRAIGSATPGHALPGGASHALASGSPQTQTHPQNEQVSAFTRTPDVVDWTQAGTPDAIDESIRGALNYDGDRISSSRELAYAAGARLWPGLSIHPAGLDAVQRRVRELIRWPDAPDTHEFHEACVRMAARAERVLADALEVYDGSVPASVLQDTLAGSIFTERAWPPSPEDAPWVLDVWRRSGAMVQSALVAEGRLPVGPGEAAVRDDEHVTVVATEPGIVVVDEPPATEDADAAGDGDGEESEDEVDAPAKEVAQG